mmetsp:Transcript_1658/g.4838  ORF Transcript_1658/g.4838 Transcript_1658/m.4838 type:complete len:546 (+) Transcript_1658:237-1874(+)
MSSPKMMAHHRNRLNALAAAELGRANQDQRPGQQRQQQEVASSKKIIGGNRGIGTSASASTRDRDRVEISLMPANAATAKNDGSSSVRVSVNGMVLDDKDTESAPSDDSFDDNNDNGQESKDGGDETSTWFCYRNSNIRVPVPLGCIAILILLGLGAVIFAIILSVNERNIAPPITNDAQRPWYWPDNGRPLIDNITLTSKPTPTPTVEPTSAPSLRPVTDAPTIKPSPMPSLRPVTDAPTPLPSRAPHHHAAHVAHVIHIVVDGLRPDYMNGPNFDRLKSEGACTLNARTDFASTQTLPNHIGMFTGLTIDDHDYISNSDSGFKLVDATTGQGFENIFNLVKDTGGTTAIYASKEKFAIFDRSWSVDKFVFQERIASLVESFLEDMNDKMYSFAFLHIESPDRAGHKDRVGASDPTYSTAVAEADAYLGQIFDLIESNVELRDNTAIILTTDHGFEDVGSHRDNELLENFRIPFCTHGPGVSRGGDLIELNSLLNGGVIVDPGSSRVQESDLVIRNSYAGVLAASWFGLRTGSGPFANQYLTFR